MDEINRRLAWIHLEASTLQADDIFQLKHALKTLITEADALLELVKSELGKQVCQPGAKHNKHSGADKLPTDHI